MSHCLKRVEFGSVQNGTMRSEKPTCAPPRISEMSPTLPFKQFSVRLVALSRPFKEDRLALSPSTPLAFHAIDSVMSWALCPQTMSQAPQHLRSSETQATCDSYCTRQSVCSVISLHSGMSGMSSLTERYDTGCTSKAVTHVDQFGDDQDLHCCHHDRLAPDMGGRPVLHVPHKACCLDLAQRC